MDADAEGRPRWYVYVRGDGPYRIERANRIPATGCTGPDLSEEIQREGLARMGVPAIS